MPQYALKVYIRQYPAVCHPLFHLNARHSILFSDLTLTRTLPCSNFTVEAICRHHFMLWENVLFVQWMFVIQIMRLPHRKPSV